MSAIKNIAIGFGTCIWVSAVSLTLMLYVYDAPAKGEETKVQVNVNVTTESNENAEITVIVNPIPNNAAWFVETQEPVKTNTEDTKTTEKEPDTLW